MVAYVSTPHHCASSCCASSGLVEFSIFCQNAPLTGRCSRPYRKKDVAKHSHSMVTGGKQFMGASASSFRRSLKRSLWPAFQPIFPSGKIFILPDVIFVSECAESNESCQLFGSSPETPLHQDSGVKFFAILDVHALAATDFGQPPSIPRREPHERPVRLELKTKLFGNSNDCDCSPAGLKFGNSRMLKAVQNLVESFRKVRQRDSTADWTEWFAPNGNWLLKPLINYVCGILARSNPFLTIFPNNMNGPEPGRLVKHFCFSIRCGNSGIQPTSVAPLVMNGISHETPG